MANTYLTSGNLSSAGNQKKWTMSFWVKRAKLGATQGILDYSVNSTSYYNLTFKSTDGLTMFNNDGGSVSYELEPSMKFRDTSGWYHIVHQYDSAQATNSNRAKLWVNGVQQSSWTNESYPSQNANTKIPNSGYAINIGRQYRANNSVAYFDGSLSHFHFCDGYAYDASAFGSTDATTGEWKINTSPSVTYGTNGFFILKDGNSVTDQSPNTNNFTVGGGTLTKTEDNPSNVFATLSPDILPRNSGESITNGSLTFGTSAAIWNTESSAFGITNGKYYFEVKLKDNGSDRRFRWGLQKNAEITKTGENKVLGGTDNNAIGYATQGETASQGSYIINQTSTTMSDGDINENNAIYGFAIDLDNQRMYGHFNGTWFHSGNPSAGSGGLDVSSFYTVGEPLFPSFTVHNSIIEINFGTGYFGTTAVATNSGNGYQDADGNGIFNYTVPTNFRCLSTKGLNQ